MKGVMLKMTGENDDRFFRWVLLSFCQFTLRATLALGIAFGFSGRAASIIQAVDAQHVAFEAEIAASYATSGFSEWVVLPDMMASGGRTLYSLGATSPAVPGGTATFLIHFNVPGSYTLYTRWKADQAVTDVSPFGANSFFLPDALGPNPKWQRSQTNEKDPPESLVFDWTREFVQYEVTPAELTNEEPALFLIGTRESGMIIDRIVLAQDTGLDSAALDALANSPDETEVPTLASALAGDDLRTVTVTFAEPVRTVAATNFTSTELSIMAAELDPVDARRAVLTTSAQQEGMDYSLTAMGLVGATGAPMTEPSEVVFRSAVVAPGWVKAELMPGGGSPAHEVLWLDRFEYETAAAGTGLALTGYFVPPEAGRYAFFSKNSASAVLTFRAGTATPDSVTVEPSDAFGEAPAFVSPFLAAGERFGISAALEPGSAPAFLALAARLSGGGSSSGDPQILQGGLVAARLNPEAAHLEILTEPSSVSASGGEMATFQVSAEAATMPVYFQWQRNGEDIEGATAASYTTPALIAGNSGDRFRARVRSGGQETMTAEAVVTVNPGPLSVGMEAGQPVLYWSPAAKGGVLESSEVLGTEAEWKAVMTVGDETAYPLESGSPARFFRLRD